MSENDDDDWFERALGEESESGEETAEPEVSEEAAETEGPEETESPVEPEAPEESEGPEESEIPDETAEMPSEEETGGGEEAPFDQGFGSAFENAPSPDSEGPEQPPGGQGDFGGGGGAEDFGGEGGTPDFGGEGGTAPDFGGGGGDEDFGFGDFGGGGSGGGGAPGAPPAEAESFDEAEFESGLSRLNIGIEGLDEMILGGVPERALMVAIGSAGTGKTTFGLQFLHEALQNGDNAVYISLEESRERILDTADEKGWRFRHYEDEEQLAVVDLDPIEMANSLASIQNELPALIDKFDADRLVLDSVSLLEMMYDNPARRRSEVFEFARSLKEAGVTTFVTSEASEDSAYTSRYGIIEYLADAVFILQYVRPSDFQETRLAVEIQKIRDANHSRETKPYEISDEGISVYRQANIF